MDMDALAAQVKARRGVGCVDVHGVCRASPEAADWHNDLAVMKANGFSIGEIMDTLGPTRRELRAAGHNV